MSSSFFPRRRRQQPFNQFGMGSWSQSPSFFGGMHPLDLFSNFSNFSNFMPPMLNLSNIIDPFLDQLMRRNVRWIEQPTRALQPQQRRKQKSLPVQRRSKTQSLPVQKRRTQQQQVQVQKTTGRKQGTLGGAKMPQKYRILIGCTGVSPSVLKTQVKCAGQQRHLIVSGPPQVGKQGMHDTQFKRSFTLPPQVETNKMSKCVTPMGAFCVEFPFLESPTSLGIQLRPQICKTSDGEEVMVRVPIPDFVDPAKVQLQLKGKEIIVRFEERLVKYDCVQRVFYYNRVVLPEGVNVSQLKAKSDKHRLIITAPVRTQAKEICKGLRTIPIQRKLRQRGGVKAVSEPERKKISSGVEKKKQLPVTPTQKKKQQMPSTTTEKKKTISPKASGTKLNEQVNITGKKEKGISTEKKQPISTEQERSPISTEKKSEKKSPKKKTTSTSTQESKGSDILKKVFGTEQSSSSSTTVGKKETSPQRQGQTSSVGEVLSGFQSSSGSEGRQQK